MEFQRPTSLESREIKQGSSLPLPRQYSKRSSLAPPTGISKPALGGAPSSNHPIRSHQSPNASHGRRAQDSWPRSSEESNASKSSPLSPPSKETLDWRSSETCSTSPSQVKRNSWLQELRDGVARVQERGIILFFFTGFTT